MPNDKHRIAGLKRVVKAELKALGELAEAGVRTSDFPRYDAQQQRVADAKADLRKAMGIIDPERPLPRKKFNALLDRVQSGELKLSDIEVPPPGDVRHSVWCERCQRHHMLNPAEICPQMMPPKKITARFETTEDDLQTLIELIHNNILDLEENGLDADAGTQILRHFVQQIERK